MRCQTHTLTQFFFCLLIIIYIIHFVDCCQSDTTTGIKRRAVIAILYTITVRLSNMHDQAASIQIIIAKNRIENRIEQNSCHQSNGGGRNMGRKQNSTKVFSFFVKIRLEERRQKKISNWLFQFLWLIFFGIDLKITM